MPACRKFTLSDAMILVAATAIALANARFVVLMKPHLDGSVARIALVLPFLTFWTPTLLLLRCRQPRPRFRRLVRQPGATACGLATLLIIAGGSCILVKRLTLIALLPNSRLSILGDSLLLWWWAGDGFRWSAAIGAMVAGVWIYQRICRLSRAEPGWIDRSGRLLGACWVAFFLLICWFYLHESCFYLHQRF
jgi:hypothetical protein